MSHKEKVETLDVLAFGPHPDDVELGCGGTLYKLTQQGYKTGIIDLTEGEMGTRGSVAERYIEAADAAKILKVCIRENLKMPDGNIFNNEENRLKVIRMIRKYRPTYVFVTYPNDRHPDHIHAGNLVTEACFLAGLKNVDPGGDSAHRPKRVIYYMITYEFKPSFLVDITMQYPVKIEAAKAYRSQFYNPDYEGDKTLIASKGFWDSIEARMRHYGWLGGMTYAEPFYVREAIVLDDFFSALGKNKM